MAFVFGALLVFLLPVNNKKINQLKEINKELSEQSKQLENQIKEYKKNIRQ